MNASRANSLPGNQEMIVEKSSWNLIFIVTTFTVVFSFAIVLFVPSKDSLIFNLRTATAIMLIGLGLIYTFKIKNEGLEIDYRALFFISILFLFYGFIFGNIAVWGFSSLFMLVSLINVGSWKNEQKWSELSEEVRKVKIVIISAIILLLFISIALLYISNRMEDYQAKLRTNFISIKTSQSAIFKKEYYNESYGFSFFYARDYLLNSNLDRQYTSRTNNILAVVDLPEKYFAGTNLSEAVFILGVSRDNKNISNCLEVLPGENKQSEPEIINGVEFSVFRSLEPTVGNRYETTSYRAIKNNACYEAVKLLHCGEISNYPEGAIEEFDYAAIVSRLEEILKTVKIL